jgi:hypothetical protein
MFRHARRVGKGAIDITKASVMFISLGGYCRQKKSRYPCARSAPKKNCRLKRHCKEIPLMLCIAFDGNTFETSNCRWRRSTINDNILATGR